MVFSAYSVINPKGGILNKYRAGELIPSLICFLSITFVHSVNLYSWEKVINCAAGMGLLK